jgi:hypothetical protein
MSGQTAVAGLAQPLVLMTFTIEDARGYVAEARWTFAKTMPPWPHEYTVRQWRLNLTPQFLRFVDLIRTDGIVKPWPPEAREPRYHHTYLEVDGWEYWTMGAPIEETTVINRALVASPDPRIQTSDLAPSPAQEQ